MLSGTAPSWEQTGSAFTPLSLTRGFSISWGWAVGVRVCAALCGLSDSGQRYRGTIWTIHFVSRQVLGCMLETPGTQYIFLQLLWCDLANNILVLP